MTRKFHARVVGRFDGASSATVTIDRTHGLISVRPLRRRRTYALPLAAIVRHIIYTVVQAELAEKKAQRRRRRSA
jgi:hypothetical protein